MTMTADDYIRNVLNAMPTATPRRAQIAAELRGHIAERLESGQPLDAVLRGLGAPAQLAASYLSEVPLVNAPLGPRAGAKLVDACLPLAMVIPIAVVGWLVWGNAFFPFAILITLAGGWLVFWIYTVVAEWHSGQTLGKRLFGMIVVREDGARINGGQAVVRQLPVLFQFYWIDVLFAVFTERSQRAFELLSKTRVVVAPRPE
jgi:uncharacterized RDD family membrane protein YckC